MTAILCLLLSGPVADLGSPDFALRDRATRDLASMGLWAAPALRAALASPDAEVRFRARVLLAPLDRRLAEYEAAAVLVGWVDVDPVLLSLDAPTRRRYARVAVRLGCPEWRARGFVEDYFSPWSPFDWPVRQAIESCRAYLRGEVLYPGESDGP